MGILRSEAMAHGTLVLPVDNGRKYIEKIGKDTSIQFEDMNAREMRRPYRKNIQRIDEAERIIRFLFEEVGKIKAAGKNITIEKNHVQQFFDADAAGTYKFDDLELELKKLDGQFQVHKKNDQALRDQYNRSVEESEVVQVALTLFQGQKHIPTGSVEEGFEQSARKPLVNREEGIGFGCLAGVVPVADKIRFERALWRASSSNAFAQFFPIEQEVFDPKTGMAVKKMVFVVYFQGEQGYLHQKISKMCQAFGVNMYKWPADLANARARNDTLSGDLRTNGMTLKSGLDVIEQELNDLIKPAWPEGNSKLEDWRLFCIKEKSVFSVLNQCQEGLHLKVDVWYPVAEEPDIKRVLEEVSSETQLQGTLVSDQKEATAHSTPPTYIRTNEYTELPQKLVNEYGIPKYQEANPALLTCVTFPFIFGMMYGDIGHGSMLLCIGIGLCMNAEKLRYTIPGACQARFMVLSMGIFATFAGFMYNDMFSIGVQLFESRYEDPSGTGNFVPKQTFDAKNSDMGGGPYPFGLDWAWCGAQNELLFQNSLKMKLSVLFGVVQMATGVCLRWSNAIYQKSRLDFICECLPMMVFLLCFFGWMDVMILYKWVHPIDNAPSIINSLICMAMGQDDKFPLWDGSVELSKSLMLYTICSVPIMLLPKPFFLLWQHKQEQKKQVQTGESILESGTQADAHGHGEEFEFGEIFIHQIIETIEFVLGTVSHTASYLRIWALSLAHQQLSQVFFQKTIQNGLEMGLSPVVAGIVLFLMFGAWFMVTLGVLLGMDVLECFLHTLRLHWVEFQSKFYNTGGSGVLFAPYKIRDLITSRLDE